ncbi:MAG: Bax inhibitor-1/YccA family protein [Flavobacterium sp.]|nr:MAG: Bax inhibitor-1/YccA family protein [Flavobacterium sp.]
MKFESKNPFLKNKSFASTTTAQHEETHQAVLIDYNQSMTVSGTINKTMILLALLMASSVFTWYLTYAGFNTIPIAIGGAVAGLILVLIASFRPQTSGFIAPGYAIFEGLFIGAISAVLEAGYPGIVIQAVGATFVTFCVCLLLYKYQVVKVTEQFKSIVIAATLAIATYYIVSWLFSMFTSFVPVHYGSSLVSIGISVFVIVIASMNLFLDFDMIEKGAIQKHPKFMEWFGAMGLMITLVWLYVEFLRLIAKLSSRK